LGVESARLGADLNEEALATARQWSFTPAMCNGKPDAHEVELTVQFQGR